MKILMIGPPGSGKGTQAEKLAEHFELAHISTGEMFRAIRKQDSPLGQQTRDTIDKGNLMPDQLTLDILVDRVSKPDCENGYILDGFPRTIEQMQLLETYTDMNFAIHVDVSDEEVTRRITARYHCGECEKGYNTSIFSLNPKVPGKCDDCPGELVHRPDDTSEGVRERLHIYHERTESIINAYREKGILVSVNGDQPIVKVFDDILKGITEKGH